MILPTIVSPSAPSEVSFIDCLARAPRPGRVRTTIHAQPADPAGLGTGAPGARAYRPDLSVGDRTKPRCGKGGVGGLGPRIQCAPHPPAGAGPSLSPLTRGEGLVPLPPLATARG